MAGETLDPMIHVVTEKTKDSETLSNTAALFAAAREAGLKAVLVTSPADEASQKQLVKRRHDLKGAVRTMSFTVKALESGYRFDDDKAQAKIEAIAKAAQVLEREALLMAGVLFPE
jgi:hypothetical protein